MNDKTRVTIVTPVHNEGDSIRHTLNEFFEFYQDSNFNVSFIVSEDGSSDNSVEEVKAVAGSYPVVLISEPVRKGYSKAVIDGLSKVETPLVSFIDSDGQCHPKDLQNLYDKFNGSNLVVGYRNPRKDNFVRKAMSRAFKFVFERYFDLRLVDPSCPFFVTSSENLKNILETPNIGILKQGFWWEFYARAYSLGIEIVEAPIEHRVRAAGETVVYRPTKVPAIAYEHIVGLRTLRNTLRND